MIPSDIMNQETKRIGRRTFLNYASAVIATGVVVGAATYFAVPKGEVTVTAPGTTVTKTVTTTLTGTPTVTPTTTTTTTPTLKGNLEFWHSYTQTVRIDAIKEIINKFTSQHPDVKIEQVVIPWGQAFEKWLTSWKTGTGPDVQSGTVSVFYGMQRLGAAIPIDDVFKSLGPTNFPAAFIDGLTINGQVWALPIYSVGHQLIYRRDLVDKVPNTWDDLYEIAKKNTDKPNRYGWAMALNETAGLNQLHLWMRMNGGEWFDEDGNINFNTKQNIEAVKHMMRLFWDCSPEGLMTKGTAYRAELTKGYIAMTTEAMGWFITDCATAGITDKEILEKWMCAWPPIGPSGDKKTARTWGDYKEICIGAKRPYQDTAKEFLKFFYQDENYVSFINSMPLGMIPCTYSGQQLALKHPKYEYFKEYVPIILDTTNTSDEYGIEHGYNPYCAIVQTGFVEEMLQKIALKELSVEDGVAKIDTKLREMLEEEKKKQ